MNRIAQAFSGKKAFIAYLMAGDPSLEKTREYIMALDRAGAGIIEVGIPFSDPIAEGEVIQAASLRALRSGATVGGVFETVGSLSGDVSAPILLMTYLNPVFSYGYDAFFRECRKRGVAGVIIPDLPFDERVEARPFAREYGVELISLVAPTSAGRIRRIAEGSEGFVYLVSSLGVTGPRAEITSDITGLVASVRKHTDTPVAVGFGIHTPKQAAEAARCADGVIVGSAIVSIIAEYGDEAGTRLDEYVSRMTRALV
jgi:tryptophan synthase alpha chain